METQEEAAGQPGTQLTVIERAVVALKSDERERKLKELALAYVDITEIRDRVSYDQVHSARMLLKRERLEIKTLGETVREDANAFSKAVIAETGRLILIISPEETRLQALQDGYDAQQEALKKERAALEAKRVAALQERITEIRARADNVRGMNSEQIGTVIKELEAEAIDASFQEMQQQAEGAKTTALMRLRLTLQTVIGNETEAKRIAEERERLARERAEHEAREAEARRQREARAAAEKLHQTRMNDIHAMARAVLDVGPAGGTVNDLREALAGLRRWVVTEEKFGPLLETAEATHAASINALEKLLAVAEARKAEDGRLSAERAELARQEAERRVAAEAEEARLQAQREELERREAAIAVAEAAKLIGGTVRGPTSNGPDLPELFTPATGGSFIPPEILIGEQPSEFTVPRELLTGSPPCEPIAPSTTVTVVISAPQGRTRPTDDELVAAISQAFFVPESTAAEWLSEFGRQDERSVAA